MLHISAFNVEKLSGPDVGFSRPVYKSVGSQIGTFGGAIGQKRFENK